MKLKIHPSLHNRLIKLSRSHYLTRTSWPRLFLAAQGGGIFRQMTEIDIIEDCQYFPTPRPKSIARAYAKLAQKKFIPFGFIRICGTYGKGGFRGADFSGAGQAPQDNPGIPFLTYENGEKSEAVVFTKENGLHEVEYQITKKERQLFLWKK